MMPKIGTAPGEDFDVGKLDPAAAKASKGVPEAAQEKTMGHFKKAGVRTAGRTRRRPGPTVRTTSTGLQSLPLALGRAGLKTPSLRPRKWAATESRRVGPRSKPRT